MRSDEPAAIVRSVADLRLLAQECKAINSRINDQDRKTLDEYRQLGERLMRVKEIVGHGGYGDWLDKTGIKQQRASEAVRVAEFWDKVPLGGSLRDFLTRCADIKLCSQKPPLPTNISPTSDASEGGDEGKESAPDAPEPDRPPGDQDAPDRAPRRPADAHHVAPKEPPTDAEGVPIPEHVLPAFEAAKTITATCRLIDDALKQAEEAAKGPGGRLIRLDSVKQQLKDAKGNLWANRPTHVCPYCHANAKNCEPCKGEGWVARHVWQQAPGNSKHAK